MSNEDQPTIVTNTNEGHLQKLTYDPDDMSMFNEVRNENLNRVDFAKDAIEFKSKRTDFVDEKIAKWEKQIDEAIESFSLTDIHIEHPDDETKRNAARLMANAELGVKLVYNRYNPEDVNNYREIKFSATRGDSSNKNILSYFHPFKMTSVQLQWLLDVSKDPQKWYDDLKEQGGGYGPIDEDTVEDFMLFAGMEEASHDLYLNHSPNLPKRKTAPIEGEFYYSEDWEFQALKVMSFFANKYFPEYNKKMKEKLSQMVQHRKN